MARPKKDNADYFPHEADMRNDDRIKALRKKHKLEGYAIWNMIIEYLTSKDHFQFEYTEFTLEIMAGDFDADVNQIQEVISYCLTLGLLQQIDGFIQCKRLENGLEPLLSKRERDRVRVSASENPQRRVEKSKGKKSKVVIPAQEVFKSKEEAFEYLKNNYHVIEEAKKIVCAKGWRVVDEVDIVGFIKLFLSAKAKMDQPPKEVRQHFKNWLFREPLNTLTDYAKIFKQSL